MPKQWRRKPELLLCPRTPVPLHGLVPRKILGQAWWNKTRKEAYASTNFHCEACGVHKTKANGPKHLEGHELYDIDYYKGRAVYVRTVPLCHYCHNYIHCGRMYMLNQQGSMPRKKYVAILRHGDSILASIGKSKPSVQAQDAHLQKLMEMGQFARWEDWRLVLFGVEYKPLFPNRKAAQEYWDND